MSTGASSVKENLSTRGTRESESATSSAGVLRELEQLRDQYRKTTNALASAAHDLKTPLAIMNGYIELLQSQKLGPLNERQQEVMADMFSSGQRLQHFIQDFLTYTVLETGELKIQYAENDMNACLSEVCRIWSNRFQERGLALYFLTNEKLGPFLFDAPKVQRVISNLLENACKYTPQGGTVWLHAEPSRSKKGNRIAAVECFCNRIQRVDIQAGTSSSNIFPCFYCDRQCCCCIHYRQFQPPSIGERDQASPHSRLLDFNDWLFKVFFGYISRKHTRAVSSDHDLHCAPPFDCNCFSSCSKHPTIRLSANSTI